MVETVAEPAEATGSVWASWGWVVLMAILLGGLAWSGALSESVLRRSPLRELNFSWIDRTAGILLIVIQVGLALLLWLMSSESLGRGIKAIHALIIPIGVGFFLAKAALSDGGWRRSGLLPRRPIRDLIVTMIGTPVGIILTSGTLILVAMIAQGFGRPSPDVNHKMLETLQTTQEFSEVMAIVIGAVIIAPLLEELFFRGMVQTTLLEVIGRRRRWTVIFVASAAFALVHVGMIFSLHALPGLFVLALVLGWVYEKTGSLWPPILIHAAFNGFNLALAWGLRG
jgi:membrane protease YdiL (CAAX protease family)